MERDHKTMLAVAGKVSRTLRAAIKAIGPIPHEPRRDGGLPLFLARAVVGQQLSTTVARSIWARLEAAAHDHHGGVHLDLFAAGDEAIIRGCGLSGAKMRALSAIAARARAGTLEDAVMEPLDPEARRDSLLEIKGVGPWTVDMAAMFYFGEPDIWPRGDAAAVKTLARHLKDDQDVHETAGLFAPRRSLLALYMWRIADADLP